MCVGCAPINWCVRCDSGVVVVVCVTKLCCVCLSVGVCVDVCLCVCMHCARVCVMCVCYV